MSPYSALLVVCLLFVDAGAFTRTSSVGKTSKPRSNTRLSSHLSSSLLFGNSDDQVESINQQSGEDEERSNLQAFLQKKYPRFYKLMINNEMEKAFKKGSVTVFVPNDSAFEELGGKKRQQLDDPRNEEIREKMGLFHVLPEAVSAIELRTEDWTKGRPKDGSKPNTLIAGIKTLAGDVPVGRSKSGGFLGWGATEDGDIVIGPSARIVQSFNIEGSFVHEVDALISPQILWRYCDQLRIPGF